jgi:hypothetical protein
MIRAVETDHAIVLQRGHAEYGDHHGRTTLIRGTIPSWITAPLCGLLRIWPRRVDAAVPGLAATLPRHDVMGDPLGTSGNCSVHLGRPRTEGTVIRTAMESAKPGLYCSVQPEHPRESTIWLNMAAYSHPNHGPHVAIWLQGTRPRDSGRDHCREFIPTRCPAF